jgi:hypothetical protein
MLGRDADSAQMKVRPAWSGELPLPQLRVLVRRDEGVHAIVARVGEFADGHGALRAERLALRSACVRQLDEEGVLSRARTNAISGIDGDRRRARGRRPVLRNAAAGRGKR